MNAKYAFALILALQVSMSMCEVPTPSEELLQKYNAMKIKFFQRLHHAYQTLVSPAVEAANEAGGEEVKQIAETVQSNPRFKVLVKVATDLGQEASPLVDKARSSVLGWYQEHLRDYVGGPLSNSIDIVKVYLDKYLPAE